MPGAFDQDKLANPADTTMLSRSHANLIILNLTSSEIDKLILDSSLNLAKYLAHEILNLSATHSFANVNEFCRAVIINKNQILHSLIKIIDYDVSTNEKISEQYVE